MSKGKGFQKKARLRRFEKTIVEYVRTHPGKDASTICTYLKSEGFKNHGLTSRKIGFHISRKMKDRIIGIKDPTENQSKIYFINDCSKRPLSRKECEERTLEFLAEQDDYCTSPEIAKYWTENSGHTYTGHNVCNIVSTMPEVYVEKRGRDNWYILKEKLEEVIDK